MPLALSKTAIPEEGGAKSDARLAPKQVNDPKIDTPNLPPDLAEIVTAWPDLPEHIREAIKMLVDGQLKEGRTQR